MRAPPFSNADGSATKRRDWRRFIVGTAGTLVLNVATLFLNFPLALVLSRLLGVSGYGGRRAVHELGRARSRRRMAAPRQPPQQIVVACARGLAGFVGAIGSDQQVGRVAELGERARAVFADASLSRSDPLCSPSPPARR